MEAEWIELIHDNDYEIMTEEPFYIRKKETGKISKETLRHDGYICLRLNGRVLTKHRIIAEMFLENPENLPCVDHINHNRSDNRLENLRWVSFSENCRNQSKNKRGELNYIDELSENVIKVNKYGNHEFKHLYFDLDEETFYFFNGIRYRELTIYSAKNCGSLYVRCYDINNKSRCISYNKFKEEYNLI